jgi:N6-L-threonylcarbamoyladenine synthase
MMPCLSGRKTGRSGYPQPRRPNLLGLETSCDETAAAVVSRDGKVLSNVVSSQIPIHARYGGVIPELASRNHLMAIGHVTATAMEQAGVGWSSIGAIAVTQGPGLIGALMVGLQFAKTLAFRFSLPLIPIHHVEGHITAILLEDGGEHPHGPLAFPFAALAVSGGHTSIYLIDRPGSYKLLGATLDDAAGEAFDKVARILGLPYPGGVEIDRLAREGNPAAVDFPRPLPAKKSLDFSFSGLKTAVKQYVDRGGQCSRADLAASFQEAAVDVLIGKLLAAAKRAKTPHVVIAGGVAANGRLRAKLVAEGLKAGAAVHLTKLSYCTDNAAMIAGAGRYGKPLSGDAMLGLEPFASGQLAPRA